MTKARSTEPAFAAPAARSGHLAGRFDQLALYAIPLATTAFVLVPIAFLFITALSEGGYQGLATDFTFANVVRAYTDPKLLAALRNSLVLGAVVSVIATALAIPMAWLFVRTDMPGRRVFSRFMTLAFYMAPLFLAIAWAAIGAPRSGLISQFAHALGLPQDQGFGDIYSYAGIVFVSVLHFVPISFLLISGAFAAAAGELDDASQMSRAGLGRTFIAITLPLITPTIVSSLLQVGVFASEQFAVPYFLGIRFNFQTLPTQIYVDLTLPNPNYSRLAAGGTMLLWFSAAGIFLFRRYMKLGDRYAILAGKSSRAVRPVELRRWRWPAALLVGFYIFLAVIAPILALAWSSLRRFPTPRLTLEGITLYNWTSMTHNPQFIVAVKNTLLVAGIGALLTVASCLAISFFIVRTKAWGRALVDYVIAIPVAIPSTVLALGVLAFYLSTPLPLYGTLVGLMLAYAVRDMGYGVRAINAGLQQVHSELTEAGYMCRASNGRVIRDIQFPLLRPTLANTWVVLFVRFAQEINLTVLLYTQATVTLPLIIFSRLETAGLNSAYPITLLLIAITFICVEAVRMIPGYDSQIGNATRRRRRRAAPAKPAAPIAEGPAASRA
jgi:iron(III) transport system permease protein